MFVELSSWSARFAGIPIDFTRGLILAITLTDTQMGLTSAPGHLIDFQWALSLAFAKTGPFLQDCQLTSEYLAIGKEGDSLVEKVRL